MTVKTILINTTHCSNSSGNKNQFTYKFVGGGLDLEPNKKHSIGVSSITIPYSFFNISDIYGNKNFQLKIPTGAGGVTTTYDIELPSSFMDVTDLNKYLQWFFIKEGKYCMTETGDYVYFMEFEYNISTYSVNCIFYPLTLPSGGTNPNNMYLGGNTMQMIISAANAPFGKLLGLSPGTYPATNQTVTTTVNSNITVEGSPIQALNLCCNVVKNDISNTPDSFYTFTPSNTSFGSNISLVAPEIVKVSVYPGRYQQLTLSIRDQENREIQMRDSTICIMLVLESSD